MSNWDITPADVLDMTGETVLQVDINRAGGVVDLYSNVTQAASGSLKPRDVACLRQAVNYQAAWLVNQPGYFNRSLAAKVEQDKVTVDHGAQGGAWREWADTLAPLAARALKNLSWKSDRREYHRRARRPAIDFLAEASDQW